MSENEPQAQFERLVLPHLDAAYNLARWLAGNDHDARDIHASARSDMWADVAAATDARGCSRLYGTQRIPG